MKSTTSTIAIMIAATAAQAGGLSDPVVTPPADYAAPAPSSAFAGLYAGLSFNRTEVATDIDDLYIYECSAGTSSSRHNNNKCVVDDHAFATSPEINALDQNNKPWGQYETQYRYELSDYNGLWLGGAESFTYAADRLQDEPAVYKPTTTRLIDTITEQIVDDEAIGAFIGYRADLGPAIIGGELGINDTMTTLDAQLGLPVGRVMPYTFAGLGRYNDRDGTTYGAGVDVGWGGALIGAQARVGDFGDVTTQTVALRVGWAW